MKPLTTIDSVAMLVNETPSRVEFTFKDEWMVLTANWRATGTLNVSPYYGYLKFKDITASHPWFKGLTRACASSKC